MPDHTVKDSRPENLRQFLVARREELQKQIDQLLAQHRDNHSDFRENAVLDMEDMSLRDSTGAQQIALLESRTKQRNQLDEALRRLREGTYGICEDCTIPISQGRLRALPFARRCLECQQQAELFEQVMQREDREEAPTERISFSGRGASL
jgi:RNA polymerase-binding transcription factor